MTLIKTSMLNAIAVLVRMLSLFGLNKILAVYAGPAGYALFGQFHNIVNMVLVFATGATYTGITKYTAEYADDRQSQQRVWQSASKILVFFSGITAFLLICLKDVLALHLLKRADYDHLFIWLAFGTILACVNNFLLAILNGHKMVVSFISANIANSLAILILSFIFAYFWGIYGALLSLTVSQSLVAFLSLYFCWRCPWFSWSALWGRADKTLVSNLLKFGLMGLVSALVVPAAQILIREQVLASFGELAAGYWQALIRISDMYLMVITTTLSVYFLPRIAEIRQRTELLKEIYKVQRFVLPLTAFGALLVYLLRDWILILALTQAFRPMLDLLAWQLVGDVLKIACWIYSFVLLGRGMTREYIATEIIFNLGLAGLTYCLTPYFGMQATVYAFCLNYLLYLPCVAYLVHRGNLQKQFST